MFWNSYATRVNYPRKLHANSSRVVDVPTKIPVIIEARESGSNAHLVYQTLSLSVKLYVFLHPASTSTGYVATLAMVSPSECELSSTLSLSPSCRVTVSQKWTPILRKSAFAAALGSRVHRFAQAAFLAPT